LAAELDDGTVRRRATLPATRGSKELGARVAPRKARRHAGCCAPQPPLRLRAAKVEPLVTGSGPCDTGHCSPWSGARGRVRDRLHIKLMGQG
jgi:hypothetical protein